MGSCDASAIGEHSGREGGAAVCWRGLVGCLAQASLELNDNSSKSP